MERNKINAVPDGKFYNFEAIASNAPVKVFLAHASVVHQWLKSLFTTTDRTNFDGFQKSKRGLTPTTFF